MTAFIKRGSRGGDRGSGPPSLRFVRGGVLCRGLMRRRGGPTVVFTLLLSSFFLARFAPSIIQTCYMYTDFQVQCSVWNGHPFYIFPLSKLWKETNFSSLAVMKGLFTFFWFRITRFYTISAQTILGEGPRPLPITTTMSSVCLCRVV